MTSPCLSGSLGRGIFCALPAVSCFLRRLQTPHQQADGFSPPVYPACPLVVPRVCVCCRKSRYFFGTARRTLCVSALQGFPCRSAPSTRLARDLVNLDDISSRPKTPMLAASHSDRATLTCSHKPVLVAEAALHTRANEGGPPRGGGGGRGAAGDLYGPGNRFRLSVREPARMTAELRAREREQEARVSGRRKG